MGLYIKGVAKMNEITLIVLESILERINHEVNQLNTKYKNNYYEQVHANNVIQGLNYAEKIILQEMAVIKNG